MSERERQPSSIDPMGRWPRLAIGSWPTPLRRLEIVSETLGVEVWAKLEDEAGAWGATKVRKLEYLLAEAAAADVATLVAYGAGTSSWAAAVAMHGSQRGFDVVLGLAGPVPPTYMPLYERPYMPLYERPAINIRALPRLSMLPLAIAAARATAGRKAKLLPPGGSGGVGDLGPAEAGLEIAHSIREASLPRPTRIFVATGTSGTAAGLAAGLGLGGTHVPVIAVRVTPRPLGTEGMVRRHVRALQARLHRSGHDAFIPAPVVGESRFFGSAYGRPTRESDAAIELARADDLQLDGTYGAKAFAALVETARADRRGPLLFIHTSPGTPEVSEPD